jgi:hypothetical protein
MGRFNEKADSKFYLGLIFLLLVFLLATMPFHYVIYSDKIRVYTKASLTFNHTLVTEEDVYDLLERYNNADFFERRIIYDEPLFRMLVEKRLIATKNEDSNE